MTPEEEYKLAMKLIDPVAIRKAMKEFKQGKGIICDIVEIDGKLHLKRAKVKKKK